MCISAEGMRLRARNTDCDPLLRRDVQAVISSAWGILLGGGGGRMNMIKGLKKVVPPHRRGAKLAAASDPSIEIIRKRAYELFLARGATHGADLSDWFKAEQDSRTPPQR